MTSLTQILDGLDASQVDAEDILDGLVASHN